MVTFLVHSIAPMFWWIFLVSLCFSCSFLPDPFWFLCIILTLCLFQLSHVWTKWALARLNVGCLGTQGQAICHVSRNYSWLTVTFSITLLRNCWSDAEASCEMLKTENFRSHQRPNAFRVLSDGTPRRLGFTFKFEMHWYMNSLYLYSKDGLVFHLLSPHRQMLRAHTPHVSHWPTASWDYGVLCLCGPLLSHVTGVFLGPNRRRTGFATSPPI